MDDRELMFSHMEDLARKAQKTGAAHSKFLTAGQAAEVEAAWQNRRDVALRFEGGFAGAERVVAVFLQPDWGMCEPEEALAALELRHRPQDEVRHRDVLGAVLGLGLNRDVLGDITLQPGSAFLVCLAAMVDYIATELDKVGRVGVSIARLPLEDLPGLETVLRQQQATVASLRLDAVLSAAFHLSRTEADAAVRGGKVQLAHRECQQAAKHVQAGQIVSLRGTGRVKLVEVNELSRKGRQRIVLGFFD